MAALALEMGGEGTFGNGCSRDNWRQSEKRCTVASGRSANASGRQDELKEAAWRLGILGMIPVPTAVTQGTKSRCGKVPAWGGMSPRGEGGVLKWLVENDLWLSCALHLTRIEGEIFLEIETRHRV